MKWNSAAEFFAMGGYGLYVWGSFLVASGLMIAEPLVLKLRRTTALRQLQRELTLKRHLENENPI